ncbi:MAG: DUF1275 domain-containing protein [Clostridiales bacterium]|nr:DUF1275 domain-containing protein [Clostridiales bacterium]
MKEMQTSETMKLGIVITLAGGFMDAYSYICRGKVFANAQTGNLLLLGINLFERKWGLALSYCVPVVAFSMGIVITEAVQYLSEKKTSQKNVLFHWKQITLLLEILSLIAVCFIPQSLNLLANSITSMACGMQVQSFRTIHGHTIATTMCIGNLRSGTESICRFLQYKDISFLRKSALYFGINCCFVFGAILGHFFIKVMQEKAILICSLLLFTAFFIMFIDVERAGHKIKS